MFINNAFSILLLYIIAASAPILEPIESVRHVQKGRRTLVIQVDLILKNSWEYYILVTIGQNGLCNCTDLFWYTAFYGMVQFLVSSRRFLRISGNGRRRKTQIIFTWFFFCQENHSDITNKVERIQTKFLTGLLTMFGKRKVVVSRTS